MKDNYESTLSMNEEAISNVTKNLMESSMPKIHPNIQNH